MQTEKNNLDDVSRNLRKNDFFALNDQARKLEALVNEFNKSMKEPEVRFPFFYRDDKQISAKNFYRFQPESFSPAQIAELGF